jgi:hypothetical protein
MVCILLCKDDIGCGIVQDLLLLGCIRLLDHFPRDANNNRSFRYFSVFPDHGACPDDGPFTDAGTVKDDRTHADQYLVS